VAIGKWLVILLWYDAGFRVRQGNTVIQGFGSRRFTAVCSLDAAPNINDSQPSNLCKVSRENGFTREIL
jgi:hypothetical protein